jgi:hypothetical protein
MAHPNDIHCQWCGARLWKEAGLSSDPDPVFAWLGAYRLERTEFTHTVCPQKPPLTAEEGAAVAFGIIGMAMAIKDRATLPNSEDITPRRE